jgi:Protein kinase domain
MTIFNLSAAFRCQSLGLLRRHPNIVRLLGFTRVDGSQESRINGLLFEYLENGSLFSLLKTNVGRNSLTGRIRIQIMFEVARTLHYLHNGGANGKVFFHRDIKSENICLDANFRAKLIDCGLVTLVRNDAVNRDEAHLEGLISLQRERRGTPYYICPSYLRRDIEEYEPSCEVFSYGVVMLELITGILQARQGGRITISDGTTSDLAMRYRDGTTSILSEIDPVLQGAGDAVVGPLTELALACSHPSRSMRPSTEVIMRTLCQISAKMGGPQYSEQPAAAEGAPYCELCIRKDSAGLWCASTDRHFFCTMCSHCIVSAGAPAALTAVPCPVSGCGSDVVIHRAYQAQQVSALNEQLEILSTWYSGRVVTCPRLVLMVPTRFDVIGPDWRQRVFEGPVSMYFVCHHTFAYAREPVVWEERSDERDSWIINMAPVVQYSARVLKAAHLLGRGYLGRLENVICSYSQFSLDLSALAAMVTNATGIHPDASEAYRILDELANRPESSTWRNQLGEDWKVSKIASA